jgi:RNA polymerase sigma factor (sigma-70 family)
MHLPSPNAPSGGSDLGDFFAAVRPKLKSTLASRGVPVADADDLVQDALITLLEHDRRQLANPEAWLFGALKLTIRRYWRWRKRQQRLLELMVRALATSEPAPQENLDTVRDLLALTAHLSPRAVMALWLSYGLGCKPREIARILGCRPDYVAKLKRRALASVRRRIVAARPFAAAPAAAPELRPVAAVAPAGTSNRRPLAAAHRSGRRAEATGEPAAPLALLPRLGGAAAPRGRTSACRGPILQPSTPDLEGRHKP